MDGIASILAWSKDISQPEGFDGYVLIILFRNEPQIFIHVPTALFNDTTTA